MGHRVLLIAVSGKSPDEVHRAYGVAPTGEREEIPESPVTGARLPGGAYLLYVNDEIVPEAHVLGPLSKGASLIACYANETVMNSLTCAWRDGVEEWSVFYDGIDGLGDFDISGSPPAQLAAIRERATEEQREMEDDQVDCLFEVPVELFAALGGLRYDQDIPGADDEPWHVLERGAHVETSESKRWWWPFG